MSVSRSLCITVVGLATACAALAQATVKPDGQFRASLGVGASLSSGNTKTSNLSLAGDAVRATASDKLSLYGNAQYARSAGVTTSEQIRLGSRYDQDIGETFFAFGGLALERNKFSNLKLRGLVSGGLGYHAIKTADHSLDLFGGLGYTSDKYYTARLVDGSVRSSYGYLSMVLGEESTHKLSETTSLKQRLVVVPNLKNRGEFRATWDAGLAVAMTRSMSLNVGVAVEHNSDPGPSLKATDTLLTTGVSFKFD